MSLIDVRVGGDGVAHVVLSRPQKRNAINLELAEELEARVAELAAQGTRSAVLSAAGPVFCAGADLSDMETAGDATDRAIAALTDHPVHWTALVRQPVLGAGLSLLSACPLVLATPQATFSLPEVNRGFFPDALVPGLTAMIGARAAYGLAFSGAPMSAERAAAVGLVSVICDEDDIDAVAADRAAQIAAQAPAAIEAGIAHWQGLARRMLRQ